MTCPCEYPWKITVEDEDGSKSTFWAMPEDELSDSKEFKVPQYEEVEKNNKKYMAIKWKDPEKANVKSYIVNEHLVYAGCEYDKLVKHGKSLSCREKELYVVMHPIDEWNKYHERSLKY